VIVHSSAIVSVVLDEPDGETLALTVSQAQRPRMSAANWLEAAMVIDSRGGTLLARRFDEVVATLGLEVVPVTLEQAVLARRAHQEYGRGNHPANLNYGDCFAYALAKVTGEPLLFKGNDFSQTDIQSALAI
jgi:ribonuclease VapC